MARLRGHLPSVTTSAQESELLRWKAFVLFGKLAAIVGLSKKHFFKGEVKKAWVPLLLHCQDPCSNTAQVRCVPGSMGSELEGTTPGLGRGRTPQIMGVRLL